MGKAVGPGYSRKSPKPSWLVASSPHWSHPPSPTVPATPAQAPPSTQHLAAVPTILHVDPVVLVVPKALNSQEVIVLGAVAVCSEWVNEKALRHLAFPRQHQDPGMHTEAMQGVGLCILLLLHGKGG